MDAETGPDAAFVQQDRNHLNVLSICHFVFAGLGLLGVVVLVAQHWFLDLAMKEGMQAGTSAPPPEFFMILRIFYAVAGVLLGVGIALNALSAVFLRRRRNRAFSMVVAGLDCIHMPVGTALGVFTLIVLMRESVRTGYERASGAPELH
jgi:hypothetical protein